MNNTAELKTQTLLVQEAGQMTLDTVIPRGSELKFIDVSAVRILNANGEEFTLDLDTKIRFSAPSHIGMEFDAASFKSKEGKVLEGNFKIAVSLNLSADGRTLITAVATQPHVDVNQLRPGGLLLDFYYDQETISPTLGARLPQFAVRQTVRATRIEALKPDPRNPNVSLAITDPPIENLRIATRSNVALGKGKTDNTVATGVSQSRVNENPADRELRQGQQVDQQSLGGADQRQNIQGMQQPQVVNQGNRLVNNNEGVLELQSDQPIVPGDFLTLENDGTLTHVPQNLFEQRYERLGQTSL